MSKICCFLQTDQAGDAIKIAQPVEQLFQSFAHSSFTEISLSVHLNLTKYCHLRATIALKSGGI